MRTESITLPRGDTWLNTLPIVDADGVAYDLTGASIWLTIKERSDDAPDDADAIIQLEVGSGLTVATPSNGIVAVEITDEDTALLTPGRSYRYDVQVRKGGKTFTPIGGAVVVTKDITKT